MCKGPRFSPYRDTEYNGWDGYHGYHVGAGLASNSLGTHDGPSLDAVWNGRKRSELNEFGGPGGIRTLDLFHAIQVKSITYRQSSLKTKDLALSIWTQFRPSFNHHSWFRPGLDPVRGAPEPTILYTSAVAQLLLVACRLTNHETTKNDGALYRETTHRRSVGAARSLNADGNSGVLSVFWRFGPIVQARFVCVFGNLIQCRPSCNVTVLTVGNYFAQMQSAPSPGVSPEQLT